MLILLSAISLFLDLNRDVRGLWTVLELFSVPSVMLIKIGFLNLQRAKLLLKKKGKRKTKIYYKSQHFGT